MPIACTPRHLHATTPPPATIKAGHRGVQHQIHPFDERSRVDAQRLHRPRRDPTALPQHRRQHDADRDAAPYPINGLIQSRGGAWRQHGSHSSTHDGSASSTSHTTRDPTVNLRAHEHNF
jgi:hypothetical protein